MQLAKGPDKSFNAPQFVFSEYFVVLAHFI